MNPPFRADQVGSLLRPEKVARARKSGMPRNEVRAIEDEAIREAIAKQEAVGLESITDGEFRRDWWHIDFLSQLDGVEIHKMAGPGFGGTDEQPPIPKIVGKVRYAKPVMVNDFVFTKSNTRKTAKQTIPSPSMLHMRPGRAGISKEAYPDLAEFFADAAKAYRAAIATFAKAGCTYLQLDDTAFAYLCDPKIREACRRNGDDPEKLPRIYANTINLALEGRPPGMTITMHTCRGNFKSAWVAEGGYESVAEAMFSASVDAFFMEFDSTRAGTFEPLRHLPQGRIAVLGLVSSKSGEMESKDEIKKRIAEAAKYVPLEQLALSPQCGFSSTHHGNALSMDEQWRKLERVVEVAREVWR